MGYGVTEIHIIITGCGKKRIGGCADRNMSGLWLGLALGCFRIFVDDDDDE